MAMVTDHQQQQQNNQPQQTYKHYCRICKKGFGCGRALGGHMRAHGINDDSMGSHADQDDDPSGCSDWGPAEPPPGTKRMYALRANPNRLKSCRVCENCGKEFVSWKSFLEHGKCSSDDEEADDAYVSSPSGLGDDDGHIGNRNSANWSKGKRSRRANKSVVAATPLSAICPSTVEEDLANCLMLLSSARVEPIFVDEPEESCASASKEEDRRHQPIPSIDKSKVPLQTPSQVPKGMFECKACKKVFTSHQALGGHRASHKKVKGCFAAKLDDPDEPPPDDDRTMANDIATQEAVAAAAMAMAIVPFNNAPLAVTPLKKKSKMHECSICHRQFASGQALGGHKRCHWITSNSGADPNPMAKLQQMQMQDQAGIHGRRANPHVISHHQRHELTLRPMFDAASETLDLNLPPAPAETRQDIGSPLRLDVPAALYLQTWVDHKNKATASSSKNNNDTTTANINNVNNNKNSNNENNEGGCSTVNNNNGDDEFDGEVKLARLSELKDVNGGGEVSPWLQVGIGSSGNEGREP